MSSIACPLFCDTLAFDDPSKRSAKCLDRRRCLFRLDSADFVVGCGAPRQPEREGRAFAQSALDGKVPTHSAREIAADGQSKSHAFTRLAQPAAKLHERLEYSLDIVALDADTRVRYPNVHVVLIKATGDCDIPGRLRELYRVRQKVHEDLLSLVGIGAHGETRIAFLVLVADSR